MNRLVPMQNQTTRFVKKRVTPAHRGRILCLAALGLLTATDASAQFTMPAIPGSAPETTQASSPDVSVPSPVTGSQKLAFARKAIASHDFPAAVESYRWLWSNRASFPALASELQAVRGQLEGIGIDAALLTLPPRANAAPVANPKQEALRLVAISRAALDRGDVTTALMVARQAEALGVPEKEFAPGEPRVWQLVLDVESAARRSGIAQVSGQSPATGGNTPSMVQTAVATGDANPIAQMLFSADAAAGSNVGGVQQVQNTMPLNSRGGSYAADAFNAGMEALTSGDKTLALKNFREAWKYEADLDPTQRNQLKDKLTLLQPTRLAPTKLGEKGELSPIDKLQLENQEKTRRLYREVTAELAKTEQTKTSEPLDSLDQLERLRRRVDGSDLDQTAKRSLAVMVDRAIADQKKYIDANRADIDLNLQNESVRLEMEQEDAMEARIEHEVSVLVEQFNDLVNERRYPEAEVIAKQVAELKPNDPIAKSLTHASRMGTRIMIGEEINAAKSNAFLDTMTDVELASVAPNPNLPMTLPNAQDWKALSATRLGSRTDRDARLSDAERAIKQKLSTPVTIKYRNRPMGEVMDDLAAVTGVPIVIDERALGIVRVTPETPITLELPSSISLESALNIILERIELTYVIKNDVLTITSIEAKRSNVYPLTYRVADLVTPIPNFISSYEDGLAGALRNAYQMSNPRADVQVVPVSMTDLGTNMAKSMSPMSMGNSNVLGQYSPMGAQSGFGLGNPPGGGGGASFADFDSLIDLIQTTVVPDTWDLLGGPSTMKEYAQNLSLVISTTSDVHDQISELLESLRRLQNLQITIEVRFITLADSFAEQIGVDFDIEFDDNTRRLPDDDAGPSITVGFDGSNPTPDLDIRFNNALQVAPPAFGGADLGDPSTLGFAILSDIEAFFFLQAIQADSRTNVMQAPKVTLFDGQFASISDITQRPFVTSITPVVGDFAVAQQPVIVVLNEGTQLNVQGLVSDDKRFVRLTLVPFFSQIGDVNTFTYEGSRTTRRSSRDENGDTNGDGVVDDDDETDTEDESDIITGTTVQLPTFASTSVSTTVSVPDGGTILLGGIKRLAESRVERGTPLLSKIPYISRLFRNVSVGRDASSLMLMVTPRIIIQEEEELAQTGFDPTRQ